MDAFHLLACNCSSTVLSKPKRAISNDSISEPNRDLHLQIQWNHARSADRDTRHDSAIAAGYTKRIGMYPMPEGDDAFKQLLAGYYSGASTARFPHNKPLPVGLIRQIVHFRLAELPAEGGN